MKTLACSMGVSCKGGPLLSRRSRRKLRVCGSNPCGSSWLFSLLLIEYLVLSGVCPHKRLNCGTLLADGLSVGANGVGTHRRGNNEGLSVMNDEWRESFCRAFYNHLIALDKIKDVDRALCVGRNRLMEPMTPGFNDPALIQAGALFRPAL